ncbi:MAG: cupin domain-containing protein [Psychroserpens sp.]|nr:cupin domain-containing protein [Psychroserpens sp.]
MKRNTFIRSIFLSSGLLYFNPKLSAFNIKENLKMSLTTLRSKILKHGEGISQIVLGDHQTVKLTGEDTDGLFTLIEQNNNPGIEIPMHIHQDEDEVFQVLSGSLEVKVGNDTKILKAGDIGFCPRGIPHSWKVVGSDKAKVMLSIFPVGLEHMFKEITKLPAGPPDFKKVAEICSKYNIQFI